LEEIRQERPGERTWTIWRRLLDTICKDAVEKYTKKNRGEGRMTGEIGQRMRLRVPLGERNILANESERMWPFYYSHKTDTLYRSYREKNGIVMANSIMIGTLPSLVVDVKPDFNYST
jgi:hypothetical protein